MADDQQRGAPGGGRGGERQGPGGGRFGGGRDGRGRNDKREGGGGSRVDVELSAIEKALGEGDLAAQRAPLEQLVRHVRQLNVKVLSEIELGTRGKLITTLMRVQRQPKPAEASEAEAEAAETTGESAQDAGAEVPASEETSSAAETAGAEGTPDGTSEGTSEEAAVASEGTQEAPAPVAAEAKASPWQELMTLVGRVWRAAGDQDRAAVAFELSGRPIPEEGPLPAAPAREAREGGRGERGPRGERGDRPLRGDRPERPARGERPDRPPRGDRPERPARADRPERPARADRPERPARPAAPVINLSPLQQQLQTALDQKDWPTARELTTQLKAEEARPLLEKAQAWELLMELYMRAGDFESVARLYERARQFDQAALAWERAGKAAMARKAYERARDFAGAQRMRKAEVDRLVEKGDRLGAATLLMSAGLRKEAVETLSSLPSTKAFQFLERVKLTDEAKALGERELARAESEGKTFQRARWLELLGRTQEAADGFESAGRFDRALALFEKLGDASAVERVKAKALEAPAAAATPSEQEDESST